MTPSGCLAAHNGVLSVLGATPSLDYADEPISTAPVLGTRHLQELVEHQGGCDLIPAWAWEQHDEAPPLKICCKEHGTNIRQRTDRNVSVPAALVERIVIRPE